MTVIMLKRRGSQWLILALERWMMPSGSYPAGLAAVPRVLTNTDAVLGAV